MGLNLYAALTAAAFASATEHVTEGGIRLSCNSLALSWVHTRQNVMLNCHHYKVSSIEMYLEGKSNGGNGGKSNRIIHLNIFAVGGDTFEVLPLALWRRSYERNCILFTTTHTRDTPLLKRCYQITTESGASSDSRFCLFFFGSYSCSFLPCLAAQQL